MVNDLQMAGNFFRRPRGAMTRQALCWTTVIATVVAASGCSTLIGLDKDYVRSDDAGSGAAAGSAGFPGCPNLALALSGCGVEGMKPVPGGFCIDTTEVTWGQYMAWLSSIDAGSPPAQPSFCSWNSDFKPTFDPPIALDAGGADLPVNYVDWCDAYAYCAANGKRLCGKIGGGSVDNNEFNDCAKDQWFSVCSSGGRYLYTYGNEVVDRYCNDATRGIGEAVPVDKTDKNSCQAKISSIAYVGVFDMNGNVEEWEDSCTGYSDADAGASDKCLVRGGYWASSELEASCLGSRPFDRNNSKLGYVGFRCCSK